ncbi:MAG: ArnT family glycosyltransferase [Candidatus Thorarchaeota archaeon]|jgi:4-amino-4-deoxy-L-arabinose transferase-like glycosyltransferase
MTLKDDYQEEIGFIGLILSSILIRLPLLLGGIVGVDAANNAHSAQVILDGGLLYIDAPFAYPPLYAFTEALFFAVFGNFTLSWKVVPQIYDLGIIVLVYLIVTANSTKKQGLMAAALYSFSPLPLIATTLSGSFDSTAAFWMLLSVLLLFRQQHVYSGAALAIGVAYKYFPILIVFPALLYVKENRHRVKYFFTFTTLSILIELPFIILSQDAWFSYVVEFPFTRGSSGYSFYNLLSESPNIWNGPQDFWVIQPIIIVALLSMMVLDKRRADIDFLRQSNLILVIFILFNKVVLYYALWYIPLFCIYITQNESRWNSLMLPIFFLVQCFLVIGGTLASMNNEWLALQIGYPYLITSILFSFILILEFLEHHSSIDRPKLELQA